MRDAAPLRPIEAGHVWPARQKLRGGLSTRSLTRYGVFGLALVGLALAWARQRPTSLSMRDEVLLICLTAGIVVSGWFPIHIVNKTNLYVSGIPLYLLCTLFIPAGAVLAVGIGMLTREVSLCYRCANQPSQVAAQVGRWMLVVCAVSSLMAAAPPGAAAPAAALAVVLLWLGDVLTCPLVLSLPPGADIPATLRGIARHSCVGELLQYGTAFLLFAILQTGFDSSLELIAPQIVVLIILLYLFLKGEEEKGEEEKGKEELAQAVAQHEDPKL